MNLFEIDREFNQNVGHFILTFSNVEFQIGTLASFVKRGENSSTIDAETMGLDLHLKLKIIRNKIKSNNDLFHRWEKLEGQLSTCNDFRRFLSHGIVSDHIPNPHLTGVIRAKRNGVVGFRIKELKNEDIEKHIAKIVDIKTGRNGLGVLIPEIKVLLNE